MYKLFELIQPISWLIAVVFSFYFMERAKDITAWKILSIGFMFGFLRVIWKFLPYYETSPDFRAVRVFIGVASALLIFYGFLEYYLEILNVKITAGKKEASALFLIVSMGYGISFFIGINEHVVQHLTLGEASVWTISMLFSGMFIIRTANILKENDVYNGFMAFIFPVALYGVYITARGFVLVFAPALISGESEIYEILELIEAFVGIALACAFVWVYKYSERV